MANLKAIRKRISTVKNTRKITRAMKMVAGARLNRAQQRIVAMRPYAVKTAEVMQSAAAAAVMSQDDREYSKTEHMTTQLHPLLYRMTETKALFIVLSSDRVI